MPKRPTPPVQREDVPAPEHSVETADRQHRSSDIALVEIAKLQSDGERLKSDMVEVRRDMRDVRDRLIALEVNVKHLPSKGFIVAVVLAALSVVGALISIAPQLQRLVGPSQISAGTTKP